MDLDSVDFSEESFTLDEFLDTFTLPKIVCVRDGYLDLDEITTLSTDQIMVMHFLKPCKMLKGFIDNKTDPDISIPLSTEGTIEILPDKLPKAYKSVKEIKNDLNETKFLVSHGHAWLGIEEQDVLKIEGCMKHKGKEVLRCSVVNRNHTIVDIPTSYKACFFSYEEPKKIPIREAEKLCTFPCHVKINGRSPTKADFDPEDSSEYFDLSDLGRIKLVGIYDYDKIVVSIRHLEKVRIMQVPITLPITVSTGKDVKNEDSMYNKLCRHIHQTTQFQQMDGADYEYMKMGYSGSKVDNIYEYIDVRYLKFPMPSSPKRSEYSKPELPPKPKLPERTPSIKTTGQHNGISLSAPTSLTSSPQLPQKPSLASPPPSTRPPPPSPSTTTTPTTTSSSSSSSTTNVSSPSGTALSPAVPAASLPSPLSPSTQQASGHHESYEIPDDLKSLTVEEVANCLRYLHMGDYAEKFAEELIDGTMLVELNEDILGDSLGVTNILHKKKLMKFIQGWRPK